MWPPALHPELQLPRCHSYSAKFEFLFQLWDPPAFPSAHPESLRQGEQQAAAAAEPPQEAGAGSELADAF